MKCKSIKRWLGAGMLAAGLATGCNEAQVQPTASGRSTMATLPPRTTAPRQLSPTVAGYPTTTPTTSSLAPTGDPVPSWVVNGKGVPAPAVSTVETTSKQAPPPVMEDPAVKPAALETPAPTGSDKPTTEKPSAETTGTSSYSHTEDYSTLCGQLQYSRFHKGWRLRYANVDETDTYGGSVTIVDDLRLAGVKDGQLVRVTGRMVNPGSRTIAPPYEIDSITVFGN